ncbi:MULTISPECIES: HEPN domain-containing protein [Clostridium]|uniref:HEPN domain-containing protein n=1 Tax=Clostridium frigoriphilum TaxID=443253 RepID=A0ABU7UPZ0_9CLOT|nr:HEPN domain-containing protein [Clostridium sp. DSM 17811]MBU3100671.1 hypothetical protein [Clostridium sp. DSM 17811]
MNGTYKNKIDDCNIELLKIKTWIDSHTLDSNIRYLVNYSVIKCCGTIENTYKEIIFDHLADGSKTENINYLTKNIINSSSNPTTGKMQRMLEDINVNWSTEFETKIRGQNQKGQLNSLVGLRNTFSHGGSITASIDDVILFFTAGEWILEQLYLCIYPI